MMMKTMNCLPVILLLSIVSIRATAAIPVDYFTRVDAFLGKHVAGGLVDYAAIKKNPSELEVIVSQIASAELSGEPDARKKAFYINAYNVLVIRSIIKRYPVKSPLDIPGFFNAEKHTVAGESITLDVLEKQKLLAVYKDPRFHFALVCAALSCPPLQNKAFMPDGLDKQLDVVTSAALNDDNFILVRRDKKKTELSQIFEWYKDDFGGNASKIVEWINQYRKEKIPSDYSVGYYEYVWKVNEK